MLEIKRWSVNWQGPDGLLRAVEPTRDEVIATAGELAAYYNESHNRTMMAHETIMSIDDVVEHHESLWAEGGRPFLLYAGDTMMGDADLRCIEGGIAEFAIMVGQRPSQGRGLGTRFGLMLHTLAFSALEIERIHVSIILINLASQRLFEKLGYQIDNSPKGRSYAEAHDDVTMSLTRARFQEVHGDKIGDIQCVERVSDGAR